MKKIFGFWIFLTIIIGIESVKQQNSKTAKQMEQYHRATAEQFITAKHLEQYHSQNSHNRYNSYHSYNVKQQSRYNSYNLERYHSQATKTD